MRTVMLTTTDNPYSPIDEFDEWYNFDLLHAYDCLGYVARMAKTSSDLPDETNDEIIEEAIDEIVKNDKVNFYAKVTS